MGSEQPLTSSERAFGLGEVQRKLRREVWESRGGWGGAEPESTVVGEGGGLRRFDISHKPTSYALTYPARSQ